MAQEETIIDPRLARPAAALNAIPGVRTYASCGGHAVPGAGQVARDKFYVSFDLTRNRQGWRALGLVALSIDKTAAGEKGNVYIKPWISSDEDEPDALSFSLEGRRGADPDEVAYWLEVLQPLHRHESDRAKLQGGDPARLQTK
jgi:hypothetical protein